MLEWFKNVFSLKEKKDFRGELLLLSPDEYCSRYLAQTPPVILYLPKNWNKTKKRYPVLYAHDGQNLFDERTSYVGEWYLDDAVDALVNKKLLSEMIVVGIYNNGISRVDEYTPTPMRIEKFKTEGGLLENHGKFLVEELKPYLDSKFPTLKSKEYTGVMGSSLGALASFYLLGKYPHIFSKAAVLSPSFWWDEGRVLKDIEFLHFSPESKIYIDGGWKEGLDESAMIYWMRKVYQKLQEKGLKDLKNIFYHEDPKGIHNEKDWAKRSPMALLYLYGKFSPKAFRLTMQKIEKEEGKNKKIFLLPALEFPHNMHFTALSSNLKTNFPDKVHLMSVNFSEK